MSILSRPEFHDEEAAYAYVEKRIWAIPSDLCNRAQKL